MLTGRARGGYRETENILIPGKNSSRSFDHIYSIQIECNPASLIKKFDEAE